MSGKLRIGIDVDDVIANMHPAWMASYNKEHGTNHQPEDFQRYDFWVDWGKTAAEFYKHLTPELYDDVLPYEGMYAAVTEIEKLGHQVLYVSACRTPEDYQAKRAWLDKWGFYSYMFGVGPWSDLKSKNDASVDWLIDDHIGNLESFTRGYPILITRPHNRNLIWNGKRIKHVRDLVPMLRYVNASDPVDVQAVIDGDIIVEKPAAIRKFETGATRDVDTNKLDYEAFFSPAVLQRRAEYMHENRFQKDGSMRAGDNWAKGIPVDAYMKSMARHFMTIWREHRAGRPLPQNEVCALMFNAEGLLFEDLVNQGAAQRPRETK